MSTWAQFMFETLAYPVTRLFFLATNLTKWSPRLNLNSAQKRKSDLVIALTFRNGVWEVRREGSLGALAARQSRDFFREGPWKSPIQRFVGGRLELDRSGGARQNGALAHTAVATFAAAIIVRVEMIAFFLVCRISPFDYWGGYYVIWEAFGGRVRQ